MFIECVQGSQLNVFHSSKNLGLHPKVGTAWQLLHRLIVGESTDKQLSSAWT